MNYPFIIIIFLEFFFNWLMYIRGLRIDTFQGFIIYGIVFSFFNFFAYVAYFDGKTSPKDIKLSNAIFDKLKILFQLPFLLFLIYFTYDLFMSFLKNIKYSEITYHFYSLYKYFGVTKISLSSTPELFYLFLFNHFLIILVFLTNVFLFIYFIFWGWDKYKYFEKYFSSIYFKLLIIFPILINLFALLFLY